MSKISVIIPTYEHASMIVACLESIFAQTLLPHEVIVVDDGSTDNTFDVLDPYRGRISLLGQHHQNGNVARNTGFHASTGDRIIFCDADIEMEKTMLEKLSGALDTSPQASFAYSGFYHGWKKFSSYPFNPHRLRHRNFIHTTSLIRREHFPGFDPAILRFQDWDLWLTMLEQEREGVFIDEMLFRVHCSNTRISISRWIPSGIYKMPWHVLGWMPRSVRFYEDARKVIALKHGL